MGKRYRCWIMSLVVLLALSIGCSRDSGTNDSSQTPREQYEEAVADAKVPEAGEVYAGLDAVVESNTALTWRGEAGDRDVLAVTWTSWNGYDGKVDSLITLGVHVWVTLSPEIQHFSDTHAVTSADLPLRLEQLLGLPPGKGYTKFVEMWVDPDDMFRPSPDPEITDTVAQLDFPEGVSADHKTWFEGNQTTTYPWTRLGYTYDWGNAASEVGLSEFVVRKGARVVIKSVTPTNAYALAD